MRRAIGRSAAAAAAFAAGAAGLLAAGCFSERPTEAGAVQELQTAVGTCRAVLSTEDGATGVESVVAIKDFKFVPDTLRIAAGTTVTWVNCEQPSMVEPHTTTADGRAWSSPQLLPTATYAHRFTQRGTFSYHCEPHPFMTATVIVE